jgi:uncharacterized delta-60 repeat protein
MIAVSPLKHLTEFRRLFQRCRRSRILFSRSLIILICVSLLCGLALRGVGAAPGDLDPAFGSSGKVTTNFFGSDDFASGVAIQPDGKIVVAGGTVVSDLEADFALTRYNSDGSLDQTFGTGGKVTTDFFGDIDLALGVIIQPSDGKIIAVGTSVKPAGDHYDTFYSLARYQTNGTLDSTFGTGGKVTTDVLNMNINQSSSVVFVQGATSIKIQPDNKIVVAGGLVDVEAAPGVTPAQLGNFGLARYNVNGTLDSSFGVAGKRGYGFFNSGNDTATSLALQADGKIVAAGYATHNTGNLDEDFACVRFTADGTLDSSFGTNGAFVTDFAGRNDEANALAIQLDGKIILGGVADRTAVGGTIDMAVNRYNVDGSLDSSFGSGGKALVDYAGTTDVAFALALQNDGKIVLAGGAGNAGNVPNFALARFNTNGGLDQTFGSNGKITTDFAGGEDYITAVALQPDNKLVAAGLTSTNAPADFAVARYLNPDVTATPTPTPTPTATPTPTPTPQLGTVTGRVLENNAPLQGVTVKLYLQSSLLQTTTTGADGRWTFNNVVMGNSYDVVFSKEGYIFTPPGLLFTVNQNPQDMGDVVAEHGTFFQFSGSYGAPESEPFATVTVYRLGDTTGASSVHYATSDIAGLQSCTVNNGNASERCDYVTSVGTLSFAAGETSKTFTISLINDVHVEGTETLSVTLSNPVGGTLHAPSTASVSIIDNDSGTATQNPIDGVEFFIRQMYRDILNRQPDSTGLQNWIDTLAPCPNGGFGEPPSSDCDRLHVAAGFFQSDEFLNRGYFAFRFYMVSFNQRPTYAQFIPDMALVGGPKSPAEEEASKVAYADSFVQRSEFLARYPGLSGQPLADALLQTAGLPAGSYNAGGQTNGQILRGIAETSGAFNKFLTEGTVSILYFGFQRRDPDAVGYQNNLDTLNANPNNLRHMIFIFIYSTEYRQRFGPP